MPTTRVLVTGSRDWDDLEAIENALHDIIFHSDGEDPNREIILVHGAAAGADCYAAGIGFSLGCKIEPHAVTAADWRKNPKTAGHIRNQEMVNLGADVCLAFIRAGSSGASDCAGRARKAGIEVREFTAA